MGLWLGLSVVQAMMLLARVVPTCCQTLMARLWLNLWRYCEINIFDLLVHQNPVFCDALHFLFICRYILTTSLFISKISTWTQQVTGCSAKKGTTNIYWNLLNGWNAIIETRRSKLCYKVTLLCCYNHFSSYQIPYKKDFFQVQFQTPIL